MDYPQVVITGSEIKEVLFEGSVIIFFMWFLANSGRRSFLAKAIMGKNDRLDYDELAMAGFLLLAFITVLAEVFINRAIRIEVVFFLFMASGVSEGLSVMKDINLARFKVGGRDKDFPNENDK
jgi:hypothetical protein